jgi:pilus assembly protein Flp/PilA
MLPMRSIISRFLLDERGATAVEYGLIVAFLSLIIIAGIENAGNALRDVWIRVATVLDASVN